MLLIHVFSLFIKIPWRLVKKITHTMTIMHTCIQDSKLQSLVQEGIRIEGLPFLRRSQWSSRGKGFLIISFPDRCTSSPLTLSLSLSVWVLSKSKQIHQSLLFCFSNALAFTYRLEMVTFKAIIPYPRSSFTHVWHLWSSWDHGF